MVKPYSEPLQGVSFIEQPKPTNTISEEEKSREMSEGFTEADVTNVYAEMTANENIRRQYDMDQHVRYPRTHPEYVPDTKEKLLNDSNQVLNHQYMTMIMTITATASLGIIAFMVTSSSSQ